jgi:hypothetical protein
MRVELAVEHHVAGVADPAYVNADLEMKKTGHLSPEPLEGVAQALDVVPPLLRRRALHVPHDDVLDHVLAVPASWGCAGRRCPLTQFLHFAKTDLKPEIGNQFSS